MVFYCSENSSLYKYKIMLRIACFFRRPHGKRGDALSIKSAFFFGLDPYDENSDKLIIRTTTSLPRGERGEVFRKEEGNAYGSCS